MKGLVTITNRIRNPMIEVIYFLEVQNGVSIRVMSQNLFTFGQYFWYPRSVIFTFDGNVN